MKSLLLRLQSSLCSLPHTLKTHLDKQQATEKKNRTRYKKEGKKKGNYTQEGSRLEAHLRSQGHNAMQCKRKCKIFPAPPPPSPRLPSHSKKIRKNSKNQVRHIRTIQGIFGFGALKRHQVVKKCCKIMWWFLCKKSCFAVFALLSFSLAHTHAHTLKCSSSPVAMRNRPAWRARGSRRRSSRGWRRTSS